MSRGNRGLWARHLGAAVAVISAISLSACGPFGGPDPKQELHDTLQKLRTVSAVELSGSALNFGTAFTFDLHIGSHGALKGLVNAGDLPLMVLRSQGRLFVSGASYFQRQGEYTGSMWVLGVQDNATRVIEALTDLKAFTSSVEANAGNVSKSDGTPTSGGQRTVKLQGNGFTVTVPAGGDAKPVHIETGAGGPLNDVLVDLRLDLLYRRAPQVTSPPTYITAGDPNSFPTYLQVGSGTVQLDGCDVTGCDLSEQVSNQGGHVGVASVSFTLSSGGTPLGGCSVNVPTLDHGTTTRVGCRISAALDGFTGTLNFSAQANNPPV